MVTISGRALLYAHEKRPPMSPHEAGHRGALKGYYLDLPQSRLRIAEASTGNDHTNGQGAQ